MQKFAYILLALAFWSPSAVAQTQVNDSVVNPNLADSKQLNALSHLDEALSHAIIAARPLASSLELAAILETRLGEDEVKEVLVHLFVPINLNSAGRDEIMLVPGMSRRMAHEFEEYRPYHSIEQFRREMGKYVDREEVARLERYVRLD